MADKDKERFKMALRLDVSTAPDLNSTDAAESVSTADGDGAPLTDYVEDGDGDGDGEREGDGSTLLQLGEQAWT